MMFLDFYPTEEGAIKGWKYGAGVILRDVGRERFTAGVKKFLAQGSKFPTPAQLREWMPDRQETQFCGRCTEGFLYGQDSKGNVRMYDCPCHPRGQRKE